MRGLPRDPPMLPLDGHIRPRPGDDERPAEIRHRAARGGVEGAPFRHGRCYERAEPARVGCPPEHLDDDVGLARIRGEPIEVAGERLEDGGPVARSGEVEAVDVEVQRTVAPCHGWTVMRSVSGGGAPAIAHYPETMADLDVAPHALEGGQAAPARRLAGALRQGEVLVALTEADVRARFGRGAFRFLKWLLDPFAMLGVYLILVVFVLDRPGTAPGLSLACAIVPFQLVMGTVVSSLTSMSARESIIQNMRFQRTLIPAATVATETVAFCGSLSMIVLMMAIYAVPPTLAVLWLPVLIVVNACLALAFAYPATLFGVWFSDFRVFAISFTRALFFLAPGLVPLAEASDRATTLLQLNPVTGLFNAYRAVFVEGVSPAAVDLLYPLGLSAVLLTVFLRMYLAEQGQFAKVVE